MLAAAAAKSKLKAAAGRAGRGKIAVFDWSAVSWAELIRPVEEKDKKKCAIAATRYRQVTRFTVALPQ